MMHTNTTPTQVEGASDSSVSYWITARRRSTSPPRKANTDLSLVSAVRIGETRGQTFYTGRLLIVQPDEHELGYYLTAQDPCQTLILCVFMLYALPRLLGM